MSFGVDQKNLNSVPPIFGIPLSHLNLSRFENWGLGADEFDSVATLVSGMDQFICDDANRMLGCLADVEHYCSKPDSAQSVDTDTFRCHFPVVLYGENGTGKTSLAMTLLDRLTATSDDQSSASTAKPVSVAGSEFYRRYVAAMDRQTISEFRQRILDCPGFFIDNVDQLEDRFATQRELVFLLDQLNRLYKPVVVTMQQSPLATNHLLPQLMSRLTGGTVFPINPPGLLARRQIIQRLSGLHRVSLTDEAAEWVAQKMMVSVPKLNHFFVQLKTELKARKADQLSPHDRQSIDMATIGVLFKRDDQTSQYMAAHIIDTVAADFELGTAMLCGNSRKQTVVAARGVAIWLLRTILGYSYHRIGKLFGNRDHTTILHSFQKYDSILQNDPTGNESNAAVCNRIRSLKQKLDETFAAQMTLFP